MALRCIFGHKWLIHEQGPIVGDISRTIRGRWYLLRCEHCGKLMMKDMHHA